MTLVLAVLPIGSVTSLEPLTSTVLGLAGKTEHAPGLTNLFIYPSASRSQRAVQLGSEVLTCLRSNKG